MPYDTNSQLSLSIVNGRNDTSFGGFSSVDIFPVHPGQDARIHFLALGDKCHRNRETPGWTEEEDDSW